MRMNRGLIALLLLLVAIMATGCYGQASMANPGWTALTQSDGILYVALSTGSVVAIDPASPANPLWSYPPASEGNGGFSLFKPAAQSGDTALDAVYGLPVVDGDVLLVTSFSHTLYAFDKNTGALLWEYVPEDGEDDSGALVGGASVSDGVVYFGSANGKVYALDLDTQESVWDQPFQTANRVWGAPALDADNLYIGSMDHNVYAVDRATGQQVWSVDIGASIPGDVILANGVLYVGAVDSMLHALDAADGSELWATPKLGGWAWGDALVADGAVYVGTLDGQVYALDAATGVQIWQPVELNGSVRAGPALMDDYIIVGTDEGAAARIDREDGAVLDFTPLEGGILSKVAVSGTDVYVGTSVGKVYAFDVERGVAQLWVYPESDK